MITQERLKELFVISDDGKELIRRDGLTGYFKNGYLAIHIDGVGYYMHDLMWLYCKGCWAERLDHKNGDKLDCTIDNLRVATAQQNMANKERAQHGVEKHGRKFRARLKMHGQKIELGSFHTKEEAEAAYITAHLKLFGEFSIYARV